MRQEKWYVFLYKNLYLFLGVHSVGPSQSRPKDGGFGGAWRSACSSGQEVSIRLPGIEVRFGQGTKSAQFGVLRSDKEEGNKIINKKIFLLMIVFIS